MLQVIGTKCIWNLMLVADLPAYIGDRVVGKANAAGAKVTCIKKSGIANASIELRDRLHHGAVTFVIIDMLRVG